MARHRPPFIWNDDVDEPNNEVRQSARIAAFLGDRVSLFQMNGGLRQAGALQEVDPFGARGRAPRIHGATELPEHVTEFVERHPQIALGFGVGGGGGGALFGDLVGAKDEAFGGQDGGVRSVAGPLTLGC